MWAFSAARSGEEAACHFLRRERREERVRMLARTCGPVLEAPVASGGLGCAVEGAWPGAGPAGGGGGRRPATRFG
jgi:hypothetical protein